MNWRRVHEVDMRCSDVLLCCSIRWWDRYVIIRPHYMPLPSVETPPTAPLHEHLTWPTESGVTEDDARTLCQLHILEAPAYSVCSNITAESFDFIVDSCMLDLQVNM